MRGAIAAVALVVACGIDCNCTKDIETYAGLEAFERECAKDEPDDGDVAMYGTVLALCDGTKIAVRFRETSANSPLPLQGAKRLPPAPSCPWMLDARTNESLLLVSEGSTEDTWLVSPLHQITWKPPRSRKYQTTTRDQACELPGEIL